ncbi:hypothetical protein SAY87_008694 [Trapa incisa]|uniref:SAM domain-containing protein n=1 Tax=Trapa incisa TaxID=236973 RepID=A0AAN7PVG0_9MYRT|nr:hypothetical protein SAY87_008694 [Trapa incisa]
MDWYGWLSRTSLDPALAYQYALEFARNELHAEDLPYFDHEFLQSMGIHVAKHRLEIIKLAKKDSSRADRRLSGLISMIARTRRSVRRYIGRLISQEGVGSTRRGSHDKEEGAKDRSLTICGPLDGKLQQKYLIDDVRRSPRFSGPLVYGPRSPNWFGPVDAKAQEKRTVAASKGQWLSGPLDWRSRSPRASRPVERGANRSPSVLSSPRVHGQERVELGDGFDGHSLWAKLFHDMKST